MMNYSGVTEATQTIEVWDDKKFEQIYYNSTEGECNEETTNAEIQALINAYDAKIAARITAGDSNSAIIAFIDYYITDVDAAAEVEIENAKNAEQAATDAEIQLLIDANDAEFASAEEVEEIEREIKYTHKNIFNSKLEVVNYEGEVETLKKLNKTCEREFNARILRKENLRDLERIAKKIGDKTRRINNEHQARN